MPLNIHGIPPLTTDLGVDIAPDLNTLKPLFVLLFNLIFKASKA
jgi:hypothetical protein